jgi:prephenate dehydrogenase
MRPGAILTDVGSTKAQIVRALAGRLPHRIAFVGAHPIAGSEQQGINAADARLFDEAVTILTPAAHTPQVAVQRVATLWRHLGCRVIAMSPQAHDRALAATSHLPHLLAASLVNAAAPKGRSVVGPSFLDLTRVAKSDPDLWDDIFLTNRREVLAAMARFESQWRQLRRAITRRNRAGLLRALRRAQTLRRRLPHAA